MNWKAFGIGAGIGSICAVTILLPSTFLLRNTGANIFGHFGLVIFVLLFLAEMAMVPILLVFGVLSLIRRRWPGAGFAFAASLLIAGWGAWFVLTG